MNDLRLNGCTLEPLLGYLKAIGVLRVLGRQADPDIMGRWAGQALAITTNLSADDVMDFFLDAYEPTPIITPWNSGSGFAPDDATKSKKAFDTVELLAESTQPRLGPYRDSIAIARSLVARADWLAIEKAQQVSLCRNALPDECLDWVDAAVVLTSASRSFPPLLGTGGNDGRLDFGSNFMQRVTDVLGLQLKARPMAERRLLLGDALFGTSVMRLDRAGIGQFDPAAAGGPGSSPGGSAESLSNPWDFVLLFEGAVAFASGVARKLGVSTSSMPFMVSGVSAAYSSAAEENGRGEFWAPVWRSNATHREVLKVITEGRVEYRGSQANNGLDVARALATLGVDRGIGEFVRYAFLERNGLATFTVPLSRVVVSEQPRVAVLGDLDRWLGRAKRASNPPAAANSLMRSINRLQFEVGSDGSPQALQSLLFEVALLEQLVSRSRNLREATPGPVSGLSASSWIPLLDDGSDEFEIAVALGSLRSLGDRSGWLRPLLSDTSWAGRPTRVDGFLRRSPAEVLSDCVVRITQSAVPGGSQSASDSSWCGHSTAVTAGRTAFTKFSRSQLDEDRIQRLLAAVLLLDWDGPTVSLERSFEPSQIEQIPTAVAVLKPVFHHRGIGQRLSAGRPLVPHKSVARLLEAGKVDRAIESALRSIRLAGASPTAQMPTGIAAGQHGAWLAMTCLIPVTDSTCLELLGKIAEISRRPDSNQPTDNHPNNKEPEL